jgi:hypothetical protein
MVLALVLGGREYTSKYGDKQAVSELKKKKKKVNKSIV